MPKIYPKTLGNTILEALIKRWQFYKKYSIRVPTTEPPAALFHFHYSPCPKVVKESERINSPADMAKKLMLLNF